MIVMLKAEVLELRWQDPWGKKLFTQRMVGLTVVTLERGTNLRTFFL